MEKQTVHIVLLAAVVCGLLATAVLAVLYADQTPAPQTYAGAIVRENRPGIFFDTIVDRFPAKSEVSPPRVTNQTLNMGLSTDTDKLDFGVVSQNQTVRKFLNFGSQYPALKACVVSYGSISPFITVERPSFYISEGETGEAMLEFSAPKLGNFTGEVDMITKRPKYDILSPLLPWVGC
jgi:hypothetical protein